jgi:hypothetical protein
MKVHHMSSQIQTFESQEQINRHWFHSRGVSGREKGRASSAAEAPPVDEEAHARCQM